MCYNSQAVNRSEQITKGSKHGGIAQLARALGSYPKGRGFKSNFRYHDNFVVMLGPVVKRLRHRPFTAVTRVRFPSGSPRIKEQVRKYLLFYFFNYRKLLKSVPPSIQAPSQNKLRYCGNHHWRFAAFLCLRKMGIEESGNE